MNCVNLEELISLYIDNMLDEHTMTLVKEHINECKECKNKYDGLISTINICDELPEIPLPENYEELLHERLLTIQKEINKEINNGSSNKSKEKTIRIKKRFTWKVYGSVAAIFLLFIITFSGLDIINMGKSDSRTEMAQERGQGAPADIQMYSVADDEALKARSVPNTNISQNIVEESEVIEIDNNTERLTGRKVINNAFVNLDVENYDETYESVVNLVISKGGYIEHSNTQYKHYIPENIDESLKMGSIGARIPEDSFLITINELKGLGTVTNFGTTGEDITMEYRDTASEIENLKVQEIKLREIMEKAINVNEILEVERELSRVRGSINRLSGNIEKWDDLVELATIDISLNEIIPKDKKIQSVSNNLWENAGKGFIETINNLLDFGESIFVSFISFLPIAIILIVVIIPIIIFIRRVKRRN